MKSNMYLRSIASDDLGLSEVDVFVFMQSVRALLFAHQ